MTSVTPHYQPSKVVAPAEGQRPGVPRLTLSLTPTPGTRPGAYDDTAHVVPDPDCGQRAMKTTPGGHHDGDIVVQDDDEDEDDDLEEDEDREDEDEEDEDDGRSGWSD